MNDSNGDDGDDSRVDANNSVDDDRSVGDDDGADTDEPAEAERERVWLVERTYSDDEQNIIILTYATPDGSRYLRKERALTSFDDARETTAAVDARATSLGEVTDSGTRERYATEARRTREANDPDDAV